MAQQFQRPKMNALSEFKLRLIAPPQQGATKKATLGVGIYKNNPRLIVKTNVPNDKDYGKITAAMDTFVFVSLLHMVNEASEWPVDTKKVIGNNSTFVAGKKMDAPVTVSRTIVGKDKEGVIYLAVTAKDRPMIKFDFVPDEWHFLTDGAGKPLTPAEVSVYYSKGWVKALEQMVPAMLIAEYVEPDMSNMPGGGGGGQQQQRGGGNWNNNKGGGGSGGGDSFAAEDDLPF